MTYVQLTSPSSSITVVFSFNVENAQTTEKPFSDELSKRNWQFTVDRWYSNNITCYKIFVSNTGYEDTLKAAKLDLFEAEKTITSKIKDFTIQKNYLIGFPSPPRSTIFL